MCVWDENNGKIALSDAISLRANMARKRVLESLEELTGTSCVVDDPQRASMLSAGVFPFCGAEATCICSLRLGRLLTVEFLLTGGTAAEQRKIFFRFIGRQDPCQETMNSIRMRYPFGTVWVTADPRSGDAGLRITFTVKE